MLQQVSFLSRRRNARGISCVSMNHAIPMKVIYVANIRFPTYKAHGFGVARLCEQFSRQGVETELIVPKRKNEIQETFDRFYHIKHPFEVTYLGIPHTTKYANTLGSLAGIIQKTLLLIRLLFLRREKDVVIYTRDLEIGALFALRGFRVTYECHDWFKNHIGLRIRFAKKMMLIVTTNPFIAREFTNRGIPNERLLVAPNGVELSIFDIEMGKDEARRKLGQGEFAENKILLYTGSLDKVAPEALISGCTVFSTNPAVREVLPEYYWEGELSDASVEKAIRMSCAGVSQEERKRVASLFSLDALIKKGVFVLKEEY